MAKLLRRLRYWLHRGEMDAELAEEMEFHRAMLADHGGAPANMGNTTLSREDARAVWIWPWLESLCQDALYALRTMRREPAFTVTALLALGSAIGLNTSLFTIFNAVALRPWPVHDPSRVVMVNRFVREGGGDFGIAEYRYLAQYSTVFQRTLRDPQRRAGENAITISNSRMSAAITSACWVCRWNADVDSWTRKTSPARPRLSP